MHTEKRRQKPPWAVLFDDACHKSKRNVKEPSIGDTTKYAYPGSWCTPLEYLCKSPETGGEPYGPAPRPERPEQSRGLGLAPRAESC